MNFTWIIYECGLKAQRSTSRALLPRTCPVCGTHCKPAMWSAIQFGKQPDTPFVVQADLPLKADGLMPIEVPDGL